MNYLTTAQAATELGLSAQRVYFLCEQGRLPAVKIGDRWAISREDLDAFAAKPRLSGRPRKEAVAA